jgi:hypothetical protein
MGTKVPMLCIGHPENTREPAMRRRGAPGEFRLFSQVATSTVFQNVRQLSFPMIPFVKPYSMK